MTSSIPQSYRLSQVKYKKYWLTMELYNPFIVFLDTTQNLIYDHLENHQLRSKRSQMDIIPIGKSNIAVSNKKYMVNMG